MLLRRPLPLAVLGGCLLSVGLATLVRDIPVWNVLWYGFAWYGYLTILLAALARFNALAADRVVRELPAWLTISVPFWFVFELYNVRLANWYYVYTLRD